MNSGAVYIARGLASGLYKIGHSGNVGWRICGLAAKVREPVEVLAAYPVTTRRHIAERSLHRRFAPLLAVDAGRGREWFRDDGSIAAYIASLPEYVRGTYTATPGTRSKRGPRRLFPTFILRANGHSAGSV